MKRINLFLGLVLALFLIQFAVAATTQGYCVNGGIDYSTEHLVQIDGTGTGVKSCGNGEIVTKLTGHNVYIPGIDNRHIIDMECAEANTPYGNSLINDAETFVMGINESGNFACPTHYLMTGVFYKDSGDDAVVGIECTKEVYGAGINYNATVFIPTNLCDQENCTANVPEGYAIWAVQSRYLTQGTYEFYSENWGVAVLPIPVCCGFIPVPIPFPTGEDTQTFYSPEDAYLSGVYAAPILPNQCVEQVCGDGRVNINTEQCDDGNNVNGDGCDNDCSYTETECGNGYLDEEEQCDDGNDIDGDGCSAECTLEESYCGDGDLDAGEDCDDGNNVDGDGCSATCDYEETGCIEIVKETIIDGEVIWPVQQFTFQLDSGSTKNNDINGYAKFDDVATGWHTVEEINIPAGWTLLSVTPTNGLVYVNEGEVCSTVLSKNVKEDYCGDGYLDDNEYCDDGNNEDGDGCSAQCDYEPYCGDGNLDDGEYCDDGNNEDGDGCSAQCDYEPYCGDGNLDDGEYCDDGNNVDNDGCSAECTVEPYCGDGNLDDGEYCDDGNNEDGDGCSAECAYEPYCGDGNLDQGEYCDDGNNVDNDGCSAECTVEPYCGDGNLDDGEYCDDGNNNNGDGCDSTCEIEDGCIEVVKEYLNLNNDLIIPVPQVEVKLDGGIKTAYTNSNGYAKFNDVSPGWHNIMEVLNEDAFEQLSITPANGDVYVNAGDDCSTVLIKNRQIIREPECGDGNLDEGEYCDDGNLINGDGCSAQCDYEPYCGDGELDDGEYCDDGNNNNGDGCSATCEVEMYCGDGNLDEGEYCDDGNNEDFDGCSAECTIEPYCGDGDVDEGEQCDDGNNVDDDECSNSCEFTYGCIEVQKTSFDIAENEIFPVPQYPFTLDGGVQMAYSNSNGYAIFENVQTGEHTVTENIPFGWTLTHLMPEDGEVYVTTGECAQVMFHDTQVLYDENYCGNGEIDEHGEFCDDGNNVNEDGCSAMCLIEEEHHECSDGLDNDGDGFTDYPADFGCKSEHDDDEDNNGVYQCNDGIDNDGDAFVDQVDPGCSAWNDNSEYSSNGNPECSDGLDNDGDGLTDMNDFSCSSASDDDENNPESQCQDGVDNDSDGLTDMADSGCSNSQDDNETNGSVTQCSDGIDNDGDGFTDYPADFGCSNAADNTETNNGTYECNNGADDDSDTFIDMLDPNCSAWNDDDESNTSSQPECNDGLDNDSDGLTDMADPDCMSSSDTNEGGSSGLKECNDGEDNDDDGDVDYPDDDGCSSPSDDTEKKSSSKKSSGGGSNNFCNEEWECSEWSVCDENGQQTRTCVDENRCGSTRERPIFVRNCEAGSPTITQVIGLNSDGLILSEADYSVSSSWPVWLWFLIILVLAVLILVIIVLIVRNMN